MVGTLSVLNDTHLALTQTQAVPFDFLEKSLGGVDISLEQRVRLACTIAPILEDEKSTQRHLSILEDEQNPISNRVIALIMLGFPKNQVVLPTIAKYLCYSSYESLRMAAALALANMADGNNNIKLLAILNEGLDLTNSNMVKKTIVYACRALKNKKNIQRMLSR